MDRLTEIDPAWIDDETWCRAREPDEDEIDSVYIRLKQYEDLGTPQQLAAAKALMEKREKGLVERADNDIEIVARTGDACLVCVHNDSLNGCVASGADHGVNLSCKENSSFKWRGFSEREG